MQHSKHAPRSWTNWGWLALWGTLVVIALAVRPLLPVDETRYLSVAWEMWQRGDWITPYLNGAPYTDKPPLLFWSMLFGWRLFGVNEWWPRLLSPIFGLISVLLLTRLARRLSPTKPDVADLALPFLSGLLWVTYSTVVLFDALLTACVLVALNGVVDVWRRYPVKGWLLYGAGVGLGALAKGPVVLVHVLPVALLAPWWAINPRPTSWPRWYLGLIAALLFGTTVGLSWAFAAGSHAGPAYQSAVLWEQSAGRITNAFAHQRPWWWYLPLVPVILFPWAWWPPLWRSLANLRDRPAEASVRFAVACLVPGIVTLSLISGKQVHYLMPLLPAFALLAGIAYPTIEREVHGWDVALPVGFLVVGGLLLLLRQNLLQFVPFPDWATTISLAWGLLLLLGALLLGFSRGKHQQLVALSLLSPALLIAVHLAGKGMLAQRYNLRPMATSLRHAEHAGRPMAYVGHYAGQFHFLGRLEHPFDTIKPDQQRRWAADHPNGLLIHCERSKAAPVAALFAQGHRTNVDDTSINELERLCIEKQ